MQRAVHINPLVQHQNMERICISVKFSPWQFSQADHSCRVHRKRAPCEISTTKKNQKSQYHQENPDLFQVQVANQEI